jgi:hypothetical protein
MVVRLNLIPQVAEEASSIRRRLQSVLRDSYHFVPVEDARIIRWEKKN